MALFIHDNRVRVINIYYLSINICGLTSVIKGRLIYDSVNMVSINDWNKLINTSTLPSKASMPEYFINTAHIFVSVFSKYLRMRNVSVFSICSYCF